jgi:acetolactate synthase-1/2/3 large subunit
MNGAEYIVNKLMSEGVDTLFGYPGGCIMPLYDALLESPIKHILCRHEQGAAFAANGYARATGRTAVCLATSGPGATNLMTGLADAYMDSVPMVAITGQVPTGLIGTDAFQEIDILGMSLPITKQSFLVEQIDQLPDILDQAFQIAQEGRPGPVLIDLPKDIQLATLSEESRSQITQGETTSDNLPEQSLSQAIELIKASKQPIIYAGGGIILGDAIIPFRQFVETTGIPTVLTLKGLGSLPGNHPLNMGMLGMHGSAAANQSVQACDLLIAVGVRFDDRVTGKLSHFAPHAKVIHLDIDPAEIGKLRQVACALKGDIRSSLKSLAISLDITDWQTHCKAAHERDGFTLPQEQGITGPHFIRQLSQITRGHAIISCDVGQHQMWVAQHYAFDHPRKHLTSGGLGAMGFGLPAAIGAQLALPETTVINIAGDGSFMMNVQELATIARYRLPIKIIILDNQALGMVRQQQEVCYQGRYSEIDLSDNPDFCAMTAAFGIPASRISDPADMGYAINKLMETAGPALLHVSIATEHNVWPMVKPGDANDQMIQGARP